MNLLKVSKFAVSLMFLSSLAQAQGLIVHEWGTFTSLVGSDGVAQNGMIYEDEVLPDFVHNFGDKAPLKKVVFVPFARGPVGPTPAPAPETPPPTCRRVAKVPCDFLENQVITQKMETPVVYFYSDIPQKVKFDVWFPQGIVSQSYPAASVLLPQAIPGVELKKGFASYDVNILKGSDKLPPFVEKENIYSHARNVASDLIQVGSEVEKFIFYRGLGEFKTEVLATSRAGTLNLVNTGSQKVPAAFLISTDALGKGAILSVGALEVGRNVLVGSAQVKALREDLHSQGEFIASARGQMLQALVAAGLYHDEARSMIDTWEHGYFKTPGLRVLYVLSRSEVEKILPVQVAPTPNELARVFIGRIEVLLDTDEERILSQIIKDGVNYDVTQLGRMAEPTLLRIEKIAKQRGILNSQLLGTLKILASKVN